MQKPYKFTKDNYSWVKRQFLISRTHDKAINKCVRKLNRKGISTRRSRIVSAALNNFLKEVL